MGNNSQGSQPPLKTAQQAPHPQSFEEEMNREPNVQCVCERGEEVCVCVGWGGGTSPNY